MTKILKIAITLMLMLHFQDAYATTIWGEVFRDDDNRFSIELEYELMNGCVGKFRHLKPKISICACAMKKTNEDGWWPDYDNNDDYHDNEKKWLKSFNKNLISCFTDQ